MKNLILLIALSLSGFSIAQTEPVKKTCLESISIPETATETAPFKVKVDCELEMFDLKIYDRYGAEVIASEDAKFSWDEKNKDGQKVAPGTYMFVLKAATEDDRRKMTGHFTLGK